MFNYLNKTRDDLDYAKIAIHAVVAVVALVTFFNSFTFVKPQELGIVTRLAAIKGTAGEGMVWKQPFFEDVIKMNLAEQQVAYPTQAYSSDGQVIDVEVKVNYQVAQPTAMQLYRETRNDYQGIILSPVITPAAEEVITRYTAQDLINKKAEWASEVKKLIVTRLEGRGLLIKGIEITRFDFDDAYEAAIRNKQVQEQEALAQANITKQEAEKKAQEILKAEALAEKTRLEAAALASQNGEKVISKIYAEAALEMAKKWSGNVPATYVAGGEGNSNFLSFLNLTGEK